MRRIFSTLIALAFILSLFPVSLGATETSGDPNIATGGGGTIGAKTSDDSKYSAPYPDGIRASIVEINPTTGAYVKTYGVVDYSNYSTSSVDIHFGTVSKLQYKSGASLSGKSTTYNAQTLAGLPRIVDTASHPAASEAEIREYFATDLVFKSIAQNMGATTSTAESMLISGKYKLLIEPMVYVIFEGKTYAFTATEAALFNKSRKSAGLSTLREKLVSVTHMNLPLALFLRKSDLGIPAFTGRNGGTQDDNTIVSTLGAGIITYKGCSHDTPALKLQYTLTAEPKDHEVVAPAAQSKQAVTLGKNVDLKLTFNQTDIANWKKRFDFDGGKCVKEVTFYVKLNAPKDHDVEVLPNTMILKADGTGKKVTTEQLLRFFENTKTLRFTR